MCADYLSRYIDNARHEHVLIKFSNKLPRLKEEALLNNPNFIPAHYHISDRPITYNKLTSLFKTIKQELPAHAPGPPHEFNPGASTPEDVDITSGHGLRGPDSQATINEILPFTHSSPTEPQDQAFNNVLNSAISHISDGTRSIITHIPYTASLSVSPAQIAKDQA